jgi:spore photoproduct lyase
MPSDVLEAPARAHPLWKPKRLLITPSALSWPQSAAMAERAAALGAEVVRLKADRLTGLPDWPSPAFTDSVTRLKQPPGTPLPSALV